MIKHSVFFLLLLLAGNLVSAQDAAVLYGVVRDSAGKPVPGVGVGITGLAGGSSTSDIGEYSFAVPPGQSVTVTFTSLGFITEKVPVQVQSGERRELNMTLRKLITDLPGVTITDDKERNSNITRLDPKVLTVLPSASGNFESILKTLPGVTSNNELSSQYSVRGGNFDENLVYVNDIEIYRPFLVRSGQQEGLSFINSEMVSSILFSAGGFDAKYGDRMSSVLDIRYKRPVRFAGAVEGSLLGGSVNLEGLSANRRLTYLAGIRQKSNQYVLGSLDTKGDYRPSFTDLQTYITYNLSEKWELGFLGNYSRNLYRIVPQNRETSFGTVNQALRLRIFFDGQEVDTYKTFTGAVSGAYQPNKRLRLKWIGSAYQSNESETFDIQGQYFIDEVEKDLGKPNFGEIVANLGIGTFLNHSRNFLRTNVYNIEHKGFYEGRKHYTQWGARAQQEYISDKLSEWRLVDSADFNLPKPGDYYFPTNPQTPIELQDVIRTRTELSSRRYYTYAQSSFHLDSLKKTSVTIGARATYWDLNKDLVISPRASFSYNPRWKKRDIVFRASAGFYYQPPFYRELRNMQGLVNTNLQAQRSIHFVLGSDYQFRLWNRTFKYVTEVYYKQLDNIVPYKVDNVRIRYYATNNSHGSAKGIDMRINGEFVNGIESWASLSVMETREDIEGDFFYKRYNQEGQEIIPGFTADQKATDSVRYEPGYIPRPTDQRVTFSIFFQDFLPKNPTYKVHLNLVLGTGLPFGPPGPDKYKDTLRMPPYRRVDIGFSKQIIGEKTTLPPGLAFMKPVQSMWFSLEVFNLLQVSNTVSYLWLSDVTNRQYAIPNYLTARQLNARLIVRF